MMLAAEVVETDRGWGGPVAILIAVAGFWVYTQWREWWKLRKEMIQNHSPTPPWVRGDSEDPQVEDGDTGDVTGDVTGWWGERIRLADGSVLVRRARAVFATGSSRLPEDDDQGEPDADDDEMLGETRAQYADRLVVESMRYSVAVDAIVRAYGVSGRTAKRDLAEAAERRRRA